MKLPRPLRYGLVHTSVLALCYVTGGGCRGCEDLPPRPTGPAHGEIPPSGLEKLPPPDNKRLQTQWRLASAGLKVDKAQAPSAVIRYQLRPNCPKRYQARYLTLNDVAPGRPLMGSETVADYSVETVTATATAPLLRWRRATSSRVTVVEAKVGPVVAGPAPATAEVTTTGDDWVEVAGPQLMWSTYAALPPLDLTHPALPAHYKVGAQTVWKQRYYPAAVARVLGGRRTAVMGHPRPTPQPLERPVDVFVGGWFSLAGGQQPVERVMVLVTSWEEEDVADSPTPHERYARLKARYVISEYGHIVHAIILSRNSQWSSATPGEANQRQGLMEFELRLTHSCTGHVLSPHTLGEGAAQRTLSEND